MRRTGRATRHRASPARWGWPSRTVRCGRGVSLASLHGNFSRPLEGPAYTRFVPTVLVEGPYRFFFYSADRTEPVHIHVEREAQRAKFWVAPVRLARSGGFGAAELLRVGRLVADHEALFLRAWNEHFSTSE